MSIAFTLAGCFALSQSIPIVLNVYWFKIEVMNKTSGEDFLVDYDVCILLTHVFFIAHSFRCTLVSDLLFIPTPRVTLSEAAPTNLIHFQFKCWVYYMARKRRNIQISISTTLCPNAEHTLELQHSALSPLARRYFLL